MVDQYSTRPTGRAVPCARSGQILKTLKTLGFSLTKQAIGSLLLLIASVHIVLADGATGNVNNALWPTLVIGYGLLFATLLVWSERRPLSAVQNLLDETEGEAQSQSHVPPVSPQSHPIDKNSEASMGQSLAALRHTSRQHLANQPACLPLDTVTASKCSDWSDLMSQVSHELRTPLNAMIGFSDVMNAELLGPLENPKYREYLAHIRDSGHELLKSAEDTLAMTSLLANRPTFERVTQTSNLTDTLYEAWNFVATEACGKSISLSLDLASDLYVNADKRPLRQTFVNLFSEALKRTASHGAITVRVQQSGEIVEIEVSTVCTKPPQSKTAPSLSLVIAQALLELQGTTLVIGINDTGIWSAVTLFDCPMQSDFFNDAHCTATGRASTVN